MKFFHKINHKSYDEIRSFNVFFSAIYDSKDIIETKFEEKYFNIFKNENSWNRLISKGEGKKGNIFFKSKDVENLNAFLEIFTVKIKDNLILSMLNMDHVLKKINLSVIGSFVTHNTMGYRNLSRDGLDFPVLWDNLYANFMIFWNQYFVLKNFYLLDHIKPCDLDRVSAVFRNQITIKNKKIMRKIFTTPENRVKIKRKFTERLNKIVPKMSSILNHPKQYEPVGNSPDIQNQTGSGSHIVQEEEKEPEPFDVELLSFIKDAVEKFIPNVSELWQLKDARPPAVLLLKIVKNFFEYGVFTKKNTTKIIDVLQDKIANLKNLEHLLINQEENLDNQSPKSKLKQSVAAGGASEGNKKLTEEQLNIWTKTLVRIRQYYSEIYLITLVHFLDEKMEEIVKENCDIKIKFDESKLDNYKLNDTDLKAIEEVEKKVRYNELVLFDEEKGRSLMQIFFTYILVQPANPRFRLNKKIKAMSVIFLNLFSNVDDMYLSSLKLLSDDSKLFLNFMNSYEFHLKNETSKVIKEFIRRCENYYLTEKLHLPILNDETFNARFLIDFKENLVKLTNAINLQNQSHINQNLLFKNNFLWVILNVILKFSEILHEQESNELKNSVIPFFDYCFCQNIFFQNIMMQSKVLKLLAFKKERLGEIGYLLIKSAFDNNKTLMVRNYDYLNLFLNYNVYNPKAREFFKSDEEYYNSRGKFYELLSFYLYFEKNFLSLTATPEFDIICLNRILNEKSLIDEFFNIENINDILENKDLNENTHKVSYLKNLFKILAKSSSKRISKEHLKKLRAIFPLPIFKKMLDLSANDYSIKMAIFRIFRNIYIFDKDNIFDDGDKIAEIIRPMIAAGKKPDAAQKKEGDLNKKPENKENPNNKESEKTGKFLKEVESLGLIKSKENEEFNEKNKEESKEFDRDKGGQKESAKGDGGRGSGGEGGRGGAGGEGGRGGGARGGGGPNNNETDKIYELIKEEFVKVFKDIENRENLNDKEQGKVASFTVKMLLSTISYSAKQEIQNRLLLTRRAHIIKNLGEEGKNKEGEDNKLAKKPTEKPLKIPILQIAELMSKNDLKLREFLGVDKNKVAPEVVLFEDLELDILEKNIKDELAELNLLVNISELYSSGSQKNSYKIYNLSYSTDMVLRYSNKLEDRQQSVVLPYEVLKTMTLLQLKQDLLEAKKEGRKKDEKKNNQFFGLTMGAIYESFKLKKLSTFSSIKKNYVDDKINNIYFQILKESEEKKDGIAGNLCKFLYNELVGGSDSETAFEASSLNIKNEEVMESFFINGQRNEKYVILEIFSNVLFHATEIAQLQIYNLIQKGGEYVPMDSEEIPEFLNMKLFDIIWRELALNFSFVYNRTRYDKLWKEYFIRTIILIKFHQYLCEDNNLMFKRIFKENKVKVYGNDETTRLSQINSIFGRFFFRNDWAKKNYVLIKRSSLFPIAQSFFELLTELMCGPCKLNQEAVTNQINLKTLGSFLDTFDPVITENIKKSTGLDLQKLKNAYKIDNKQMADLKMSICDFLLTICEGHDPEILKNQLKKINFNEIMETVIKMIKILIFKYSNGKKHNLTYGDYLSMKTVYQNSGFDADQTMILEMALKLFMYLKILSQESINLRHLLETKEKVVFDQMQKQKFQNKLSQIEGICKRRKKKIISIDDIEEVDIETRGNDFHDGLCMKFLGKFAKKLQINDKKIIESDDADYIFFEPNPKFSFLSQESKDEFLEKVDRSSHESKIHGLINSCQYFEDEINIREKIKQRYSKLTIWFSSFKEFEISLFLMSILINIFLILDYQYEESESIYQLLVKIFAFIELGGSGVCFIVWFLIRYKVEKRLYLLELCEQKGMKLNKITYFEEFKVTLNTIFSENIVRILIMHIVCCILGLLSSVGFFAIDIFTIVNLVSTFKYLARSFSINGTQLIYSFFMAFIIIYIYSVFSNLYFKENYASGICSDFVHCYFLLLNTAFTNGAGIGAIMNPETLTDGNKQRYFGYVFIALTFFITVNCITLNIVFSIIVDSFGELRMQSEKYGKT